MIGFSRFQIFNIGFLIVLRFNIWNVRDSITDQGLLLQGLLSQLKKIIDLYLMPGVSPKPIVRKPKKRPKLHQGWEDKEKKIKDPLPRSRPYSDDLCVSDL